MNDFYMYILKCNDNSYYVGHTDTIETRISEHQLGLVQSCYTYRRRPISVVYIQIFATRDEALEMERQIKGWSRKKKEGLLKIIGKMFLCLLKKNLINK